MPAERWMRLGEEFSRLLDLPPAQRRGRVRQEVTTELRDDLLALLASHEELMTRTRFAPVQVPLSPFEPLAPGALLGNCRIVRRLGAGGMGVVYLAEQARPSRAVAIKIVRPDRASSRLAARFQFEADALGRLSHPAVARVFEVGAAEIPHFDAPLPYMICEYIEGTPLGAFLEAQAPAARARVELLWRICLGVAHAHENGVIHRDLKPSNILIDRRGEPKILDFGVARILDQDAGAAGATQAGELVGTLAYMSPEQVSRGDAKADTRTDVYGLGLVGYFMLTGRPAYNVSELPLSEAIAVIERGAERAAREADLPRDLRFVLRKALAADPAQRYSSAGELAEDLRRYLSAEPVRARPASAAYLLRLLARRHKWAFAASVTVAVSLVASTIISVGYALRAERAGQRARDAADRANAIIQFFLKDVLEGALPDVAQGRELTVREMTQRASALVESIDEPRVRAAVHQAIAGIFRQLALPSEDELRAGLLTLAVEHARQAVELLQQLSPQSLELAEALEVLADALGSHNEYHEAVAPLAAALALREQLHATDPQRTIAAYCSISTWHLQAGELTESRAWAERAMSTLASRPMNHRLWADTLCLLADCDARAGDWTRAQQEYAAALDHARQLDRTNYSMECGLLDRLARALAEVGRIEESRARMSEAQEMQKRYLPKEARAAARMAASRAATLLAMDDLEGALRYANESIALYSAAVDGAPNDWAARVYRWRGAALWRLCRLDEAIAAFDEALYQASFTQAGGHPDIIEIRSLRGACLTEEGRFAEAAAELLAVDEALSRLAPSVGAKLREKNAERLRLALGRE